jgi:arylsulfatase A-like enzyme
MTLCDECRPIERLANRRVLMCGALIAVLGSACHSDRPPPNLLLIVVDTLRADRLGSYGSQRGLTPFMDELAAKGAVFANTYAASSWTSPSVASMLTSRYPSQHTVTLFESVLPQEELTLVERLSPLRYRTGGFSANLWLAANRGYDQGFDSWSIYLGRWINEDRSPKVRAATLNAKALEWLDTARAPAEEPQPIFLYLQYMDPHSPYDPPQPFRRRHALRGARPEEAYRANQLLKERAVDRRAAATRFDDLEARDVALLESLYDAEVASLDAALRELFSELEERGFLDDALVVLTSDHGEEFRERGVMLHGLSLYEESLRVPLILQGRGIEPGRVIQSNVSLIDLAPTLLELLGLPRDERLEGRSLVPLLEGAASSQRDLLFELPRKQAPVELRVHSWGILRDALKLVVAPSGEQAIYDVASEAGEDEALDPGSNAAHDLAGALQRLSGLSAQPLTTARADGG